MTPFSLIHPKIFETERQSLEMWRHLYQGKDFAASTQLFHGTFQNLTHKGSGFANTY